MSTSSPKKRKQTAATLALTVSGTCLVARGGILEAIAVKLIDPMRLVVVSLRRNNTKGKIKEPIS